MEEIFIKAEIFKIIRANDQKKAKQVLSLVARRFPDEDWEKLKRIISELMKDLL